MAENKSASFEASLERLGAIVKELETDGIELERSVALYQEGRALVKQCEVMLGNAEATLRQNAAAPAPAEPADDEIAF